MKKVCEDSAPGIDKSKVTGVTTATASNCEASSITSTQLQAVTAGTDIPRPLEKLITRPSYAVYDQWVASAGRDYRSGVWYHGMKSGRDGNVNIDEWLCSPLYVEAITSCDGRDFGRLLRFRNSLGQWKRWAMPMSHLKGSCEEMRGELLNLGLEIDPSNRTKLAQYIFNQQPKRKAIAAQKTGWHGEKLFVLPHRTIGDGDVVFQSPIGSHADYTTGGSLEEWKERIGQLCIGNNFLIFSISAALGAPLFTPLHRSGAGVHFSGDSSQGKTTGAYVAASVWGHAKTFISTWRATSNGLEGAASMRNDTCMILDEMKQCDPKDIDKIVYMLANGQGKTRANRAGSARPVSRWNSFLISNGEASLSTFMEAGGIKVYAGQEVRLPTIPVTGQQYGVFDELHGFDSGKVFADNLQTMANTYYGHLGPEFIERLVESEEYSKLSSYAQDLQLQFPAIGEQEGRVAGNFAIIALAGELAIDFGLLPWERGTAVDAAVAMFKLWSGNRDRGNAEGAQVLRSIRAFLARHGGSRFESADVEGRPIVRDRAGWWRDVDGRRVYMFTSDALKEACPGMDVARITRALFVAGCIHSRDKERMSKCSRVRGVVRRLYWIQELDSGDE